MPKEWVEPGTGRLRRNLSKLEYQWRFTVEEQAALEVALDTFPDATVRGMLRVLDKSLSRVEDQTGVDVRDLRTIEGAWYAVGVLAALGVVTNTEGAIVARVAEILADPA